MRRFVLNLLLSASYFVGIFTVFALVIRFCGTENPVSRNSFLVWDTIHYYDIVKNGYNPASTAFFPLFPFFWKITGLGGIGIAVLNGIIFILSVSYLATVLNLPSKIYLLLLTFPSIFFCFIPYSESLFFLGGCLLLVGIIQGKNYLALAGILIDSITRPVAAVFVPAFIIMALFTVAEAKERRRNALLYSLTAVAGLLLVLFIQYSATGEWFTFFKAQRDGWGNSFRLPRFHFTSWNGDNIVRLDATAFLIGMSATAALGYMLLKRKLKEMNPALLFSLLYLAGICWLVLFTRGGSMFSLNRFIYATPFFFVALPELIKIRWSIKNYILLFVTVNAFWLLFGSYVHIQQVLIYLLLTIFLFSLLFISHPKRIINMVGYSVFMLGNITLQIYFFQWFLNGGWVG